MKTESINLSMKAVVALIIISSSILSGCKDKEDPAPTIAPDLAGVFIGGFLDGRATYWKDDVAIPVGDETKYSDAWGLFVDGPDLYLAGSITDKDPDAKNIPVYWKNGQMISLPYDKDNYATATGVAILNGDVHVIGTEYDGTHTVAKYWKNGKEIKLTNGTTSWLYSIQINDNDVYIFGRDGNVIKYWKNGIASSITLDGTAMAMFVSGNDVYFAGAVNSTAAYWKNGVVTKLNESTEDTAITSLFVSGIDVYVAGVETSPDFISGIAKYWKNGVVKNLNDRIEPIFTDAIAVSGDNVYVIGFIKSSVNSVLYTPTYWKNGEAHSLSAPAINTRLTSIVIK